MARRERADHGADVAPLHSGDPYPSALLALYPGLRQTGWAVFAPCRDRRQDGLPIAASGVVALKTRRKVEPAERIAHQLEELTAVAARWRPGRVVLSAAGGMNWRLPGREQLDQDLRRWTGSMGLSLTGYSATEVRSAIAGQPNASKDALGYAVMLHLGLIGQSRAAAEWEAIAVGCHHLQVSAEWLARSGAVC